MAKDFLDERLAGLGLPEDIVEVALDGESTLSEAALERMKRMTLQKVTMEVNGNFTRLVDRKTKRNSGTTRQHPLISFPRGVIDMFKKIALVAACFVIVALGVAGVRGLNVKQAPSTGSNGTVAEGPGTVTPPVGQGGDAIDLPPETGDVEKDAAATVRKFYSILNEKDFDNSRRLFYNVNVSPSAMNVKGIISYTYKSGELVSTEEEFVKTPGDTIIMKVVVNVEADGQVESQIYKAGDNTLYVRMIQGNRWGIQQFTALDGNVWPADKLPEGGS